MSDSDDDEASSSDANPEKEEVEEKEDKESTELPSENLDVTSSASNDTMSLKRPREIASPVRQWTRLLLCLTLQGFDFSTFETEDSLHALGLEGLKMALSSLGMKVTFISSFFSLQYSRSSLLVRRYFGATSKPIVECEGHSS